MQGETIFGPSDFGPELLGQTVYYGDATTRTKDIQMRLPQKLTDRSDVISHATQDRAPP